MKFFDLFRTNNKIVLSNVAADGSRPELTVRMAEKLLGEKVQNMAMYNLKTLKPLKDTYNDQKLIYGRHVSRHAENFIKVCQENPKFKNKKPMWVVAKTVSHWFDKSGDLMNPVPEYVDCGCLVIANVIFYDMKQKKYTPLYSDGSWFRVGAKHCYVAAAEESICNALQELSYRIR